MYHSARKVRISSVGTCVGINNFIILYFNLDHEVKFYVRVRPSHHKNINGRQRTSFFVSKIQCLQGSSRILTLPTYTQLNRHQVNDVGTFAGICRFDKVLYPQFGCEDS